MTSQFIFIPYHEARCNHIIDRNPFPFFSFIIYNCRYTYKSHNKKELSIPHGKGSRPLSRQGGKEVRVTAKGDLQIACDHDGSLNYLFVLDPSCCCHGEEGDYQWGNTQWGIIIGNEAK